MLGHLGENVWVCRSDTLVLGRVDGVILLFDRPNWKLDIGPTGAIDLCAGDANGTQGRGASSHCPSYILRKCVSQENPGPTWA